jgi:hypothetical protein
MVAIGMTMTAAGSCGVRPHSDRNPTPCGDSSMTREQIQQRLVDLEREIEGHRTAIWLAERSRDEALFELRRIINKETAE